MQTDYYSFLIIFYATRGELSNLPLSYQNLFYTIFCNIATPFKQELTFSPSKNEERIKWHNLRCREVSKIKALVKLFSCTNNLLTSHFHCRHHHRYISTNNKNTIMIARLENFCRISSKDPTNAILKKKKKTDHQEFKERNSETKKLTFLWPYLFSPD